VGFLDWLFGGRKSADTDTPPLVATNALTAARPNSQRQSVPHYAVVDVETTGLSPTRDRVLELAIVRTDRDGNVVDEWVSRFNPEGPVGATHIHGIRDHDVANAPLFRDAAQTISSLLSGLPIVAHNAKFDLGFLRAEFAAAGWDLPALTSYCTMNGSHHYLPELERRRLADCCWGARVELNDAHSALGDARATAALLRHYLTMGRARTPHGELSSLSASPRWPGGPARPPQLTRPPQAARTRATNSPSRSAPARWTPARPAQPALMAQLTSLSILDVIDEGAPVGTAAYIELLFDALEDGDISAGEAASLAELAQTFELTQDDLNAAHKAFLLALAHHALSDGRVSANERQELNGLADLLSVPTNALKTLLNEAEASREARLGAGLKPLPVDWAHGEPLRVGHKVAFTGCDERQRERLERRAEKLGVRVMNNISKMTVMLITDGSFSGGKHASALELGTRTVHPDVFEILLKHLQPALTSMTSEPSTTRTERAIVASATSTSNANAGAPPAGSPFDIRSWASANGYVVGVRGRLPREVVDAYNLSRELV
jgi:DNA polymerase-3 subunit epsilon